MKGVGCDYGTKNTDVQSIRLLYGENGKGGHGNIGSVIGR